MRISLKAIKNHKFFIGKNNDAAKYWEQVSLKEIEEIPYKPNPMKY